MAFNIGINVVETDGKSTPAIAGAPTSVTGMLLRSRRGPTDQAVRVSSFQGFVARFGGYDARFSGAYAVDGFFQNGGREAYVARVVGAGSAAASVTLQDRAGNDTLTVTAGYRGSIEPGTWGNDLYVRVTDNPVFSTQLAATLEGNQPARLQGEPLPAALDLSPPADGTPHTLTIEVDDPAVEFVVTLDSTTLPVPAQANAQDVVDAINAQAGSRLVAQVVGGGILLVSRAKGEDSRVTVGGADAETRALLGFPDGNTSASGAAGANPPYTGAQVRSLAGLSVGAFVRLDDGITSDWRQITALVEGDDGAGNPVYTVQWGEPPEAERNEYRVEDGATLSTCEFDLSVLVQSAADPAPQVVETWEKVTLDPAALTRVEGVEGVDPSTADYRAALALFDSAAIQLLIAPEVMPDGMLAAVTRAALDYCAGPTKGDCMFIGHTPPGRDAAGAKAFGQDFRAAKVYGALYWPWVTVTDPIGAGPNPTRVVPPTGHVAGVYARVDQTRGVWKAPAGNEATIRGALAVERDLTDVDHTDLVKNGSVNGIRRIRGTGIVIDASRTLSTDTRWLYVNVRLLFNYVKASLRDGLRWVKQEPNRDTLWNKVKYNAVTPFLLRLYQEGAFGTGTPEETFTVICGPENNPPAEVMLGNLRVEVYFYPSRPAETIIIIVGQQEAGGSAGEA